ncbi:hypothetical protein C2I19_19525, partial [Chromobacterium alticapitis]
MDPRLSQQIERALIQDAAELLKLPLQRVRLDAQMTDYGFDSIAQTAFSHQLNKRYGLALTPTQFFETTTLGELARHLADRHGAHMAQALGIASTDPAPTPPPVAGAASQIKRVRIQPARAPLSPAPAPRLTPSDKAAREEPIAVIGMSGCFPQAPDLDALWDNLRAGRDCISEVPSTRWNWDKLADELGLEPGLAVNRRAGVIDSLDQFDPLFFRISPREALSMDPQQRLLMTYVWKAVEDAGYSAASLAGSKTALIAGTAASGYASLLTQAKEPIEGYSTAGTVPSMGPNRTSYWMDWHGPSEPIDTACSSSLIAIHRAVSLLRQGECDMAVVGGVNTLIAPEAQVSFSKAGMLSPDGRCKTFSAQADGYVRGEGVGMLMLKPLSAAERDGDHIYGLIRGSAENHGGKATSLTAPNPKAQTELIKTAFQQAGIDPATVGYIEAHGTGTPLGDPIEVQGLKNAFDELAVGHALPADYCGLGSVKTNIGHLELAAGVAGVIKVLLQMRHRTLAKSLHCDEINPYIDLRDSPFYIVRDTQPWTPLSDAQGKALPLRAGVSSFGFGGANAHVVLEEYLPATPPAASSESMAPALVVLSARDAERLQALMRQWLDALRRGRLSNAELRDAAYTLQIGRIEMPHRFAAAVSSVGEWVECLQAALAGAADGAFHMGTSDEADAFLLDESLAAKQQAWLAQGRYHELLRNWTKGMVFDWDTLHLGALRRRLSLPGYAFAPEHYWIAADARKPVPTRASAADAPHPLLHRNTSDLSAQRYAAEFSG